MTGDTEEWRAIPGYEGYEVSDRGRVRSWKARKGAALPYVLKPQLTARGYLAVSLHLADRRRQFRTVHSLVMLAFVGPRPTDLETRHLDGNPLNNGRANLTYGTKAENMRDTIRHGTNRNTRKTGCIHGHPFTPENTILKPNGARGCRECARAGGRRSYRKAQALAIAG